VVLKKIYRLKIRPERPATQMPRITLQTLESIIHHHLQCNGLTEAMLTGAQKVQIQDQN